MIATLWSGSAWAAAFTGVFTFHNDNARTGQNLAETVLTPQRLSNNKFGRLFSVPVDGYIYGQPLYVPAVNLGAAGTHNVIVVATEHDSVYAFDADTQGAPLWQVSFIDPVNGITTVPNADVGSDDIVPEIGITSTPVIDPSTNIVYVVSKVKDSSGQVPVYIQKLHALDLATGSEILPNSPVTLTATVPGTGEGGTTITWNSLRQNQRSALTLVNIGQRKTVYIASASHGDNQPYHGWVLGYDATSLTQVAAFNATPNGSEGGIWQSGSGPAVDANGNLFVLTGNGTFDANTGGSDYGDSFINLAPDANGALSVESFFTPSDQDFLDEHDLDEGSGGSLLLPDQSSGPPHLMLSAGKDGIIYLLNRDDMGGFNSGSNNVDQALIGEIGGLFSAPTYWNGQVFFVAEGDPVKSFSLSGGKLSGTPISKSTFKVGFPGATTALSANGNNNAILWLIDSSGYSTNASSILYALDPDDLTEELYSSSTAAADNPGPAVKFSVPTVANGKVYVGTETQLSVFGLEVPLPPTVAAQLKFSPAKVTFAKTIDDGHSRTKRLTLKNPKNGKNGMPIAIEGFETDSPFVADSSQCPAVLQPGTSCKVNITFTPDQVGIVSGSLTIDDNSEGGALVVPLSGTGVAPKVKKAR